MLILLLNFKTKIYLKSPSIRRVRKLSEYNGKPALHCIFDFSCEILPFPCWLTEYTLLWAGIPLGHNAAIAGANIAAHKVGAQHWPLAGPASALCVVDACFAHVGRRQALAIDEHVGGGRTEENWPRKCRKGKIMAEMELEINGGGKENIFLYISSPFH